MSYEAWNKKLAKVRELRAAGSPIWYSRTEFNDPNFRGMQPKWHLAVDRKAPQEGERGTYTWVALCGYKFGFWETLLDVPRLKLGKAKPPVKERCTRCVQKAAKLAAVPPTK